MVAKAVRVAIIGVLLSVLVIGEATALPGDLDVTFGGDGVVYTTFHRSARATGVALQPDGKIVAVGASGLGFRGRDSRFAITRFLADGNPDQTFGGDGRITTNLSARADVATDVVIQADGKIVVTGRSGGKGGRFGVVRYKSDGSLDATFGGDGIVLTDFTAGDDIASAVALQSDGKIVVAGTYREGFFANSRFALARYLTDGSLDPAFSVDGTVTADFTSKRDSANGMTIQADGKILVVGRAAGARGRFALVRFELDGVPDSTFGTSGKVMTNFTKREDAAADVAIQSDGKLVVVGVSGFFFSERFTLARYTPEGLLDDTFSGDGRVRSNFGVARAVVLQTDGKIVVSGYGFVGGSGCETGAMLSRFTTTGAPDESFGEDGTTATSFNVASDAQDLVVQPDGAIVVAGGANFCGFKSTFAVLRYLAA